MQEWRPVFRSLARANIRVHRKRAIEQLDPVAPNTTIAMACVIRCPTSEVFFAKVAW